jgi:CheY-like chemotaxis protein
MRKRLVLVVEDEAVVREVVAALIPDEPDLTAAVVRTAEEAVRAATEMHPDLVLLDLAVPGLDGAQLARRLRHEPCASGARLVALTPLAGSALPRAMLAAGCDAVVAAPSDADGLLGGPRRPEDTDPEGAPWRPHNWPTRAELDQHTAAISARAAVPADRSARLSRRALQARDDLTWLVQPYPRRR